MSAGTQEQGATILSELGRRHGERWVLRDLTLQIGPRARLAVLGRSGAGKSTLLRLIAGLDAPDAGEVKRGEQVLSRAGAVAVPPAERSVGLVFQDLALWSHLSVEASVTWVGRGTRKERRDTARRLASAVGLGDRLDAYSSQLSGGEQQRLALARALAPKPELLLLDEPFAHLDRPLRWELGGRLLELLDEQGAALVLVTHERREALELAQEALILVEGQAQESGTLAELCANPTRRATAELLDLGNVLPRGTFKDGDPEASEGGELTLYRFEQLQLASAGEGVAATARRTVYRPEGSALRSWVEVEFSSGARALVAGEAQPGAVIGVSAQGRGVALR